jgi:hypothetical protein
MDAAAEVTGWDHHLRPQGDIWFNWEQNVKLSVWVSVLGASV